MSTCTSQMFRHVLMFWGESSPMNPGVMGCCRPFHLPHTHRGDPARGDHTSASIPAAVGISQHIWDLSAASMTEFLALLLVRPTVSISVRTLQSDLSAKSQIPHAQIGSSPPSPLLWQLLVLCVFALMCFNQYAPLREQWHQPWKLWDVQCLYIP